MDPGFALGRAEVLKRAVKALTIVENLDELKGDTGEPALWSPRSDGG
jgi:hypothetical protein